MVFEELFLIPVEQILLLGGLAFILEYFDSSFGMGYGTILTPLLILVGMSPLQIVPAILVSELFTGSAAAIAHQKLENVTFDLKSKATRIAALFSVCSIIGVIIAVAVAIKLPKEWLIGYIGFMVLAMGVIVLFIRNRSPKFSWLKIALLGSVASFNKGISGGGYGPLLTGGQIASGVDPKNAVAITSLAESVTCLAGILTYFFLSKQADWTIAPVITIGALLAIPFTAYTIKLMDPKKLKTLVGVFITLLGILTISKLFF
jgi:uncharacterized membrane protein YfcA